MLAALTLAFLVDAPVTTGPLREVVYKVASVSTRALSIETFGGSVPVNDQPATPGMPNTLFAPQPTAQRFTTGEDGTLVIDVIAVDQDVVRANVTEHLRNRSTPRTYAALVSPNGLVSFNVPDPSPTARFLLPLFAIRFAPPGDYDPGSTWHVSQNMDVEDLDDLFTVTGQDGALLLVDEQETIRVKAAKGMNFIGSRKFPYKPSLLIPISGSFEEHGSRGTMDSNDEMRTTVHFDRVSDSRDSAPAPTKQ